MKVKTPNYSKYMNDYSNVCSQFTAGAAFSLAFANTCRPTLNGVSLQALLHLDNQHSRNVAKLLPTIPYHLFSRDARPYALNMTLHLK
jgi:hypothetical protein